MSKRRRLLARYEAYRHIRRADADERQKAEGRITLASTSLTKTPIFNRDKRRHVLDQVIDLLRDWRQSPFEHEGSTIAGLRGELCLQGYGWHRSDNQARDIVAEGLRQIGAKRPTYDQGQREYSVPDGVCVWCYGEIDQADAAYGRTGKFCSVKCAEAMRFHRAEEWDQRTSAMNRAAADAIAREKIDPIPCLHCGTMFRPLKMDARGRKFCSHECVGAFRRQIPERECEHCRKVFQPINRTIRFCSNACKGKASRTLHPRMCGNPACATMFRPRDAEQRYCCTACRNTIGLEAKHERECLWCQKPFLGKHPTSKFCSTNCKSMEYQCRSGRKPPKVIRPPVLDYLFRRQGLRITGERMAA